MNKYSTTMKVFKFMLYVSALVTMFYLLMLGWFNNLVADDFAFVCDAEKRGIWGFIANQYMRWQGRFSYYFVLGIFYALFGRSDNLVIYSAILLILGYLTYYRLFRDLVPDIKRSLCIPFAVLICNLSIMSFFDLSTFYWVCTPDYFLLMYATILLSDMLFLCKWKPVYRWTVIGICALYICGNLELYLAILIFFLGVGLLIWVFCNPALLRFNNERFKMLFFVLCVFLAGFIIQWLAPGTKIRMAAWQMEQNNVDFLHHFSFIPFLRASLKALFLLLMRVVFQMHYYVLVFIIALGMGYMSKGRFPFAKGKAKKIVKYVIAGYALFFLVTVEISVLSLSCLAPIRSYTFIHYLLLFCIGYIGLLFGASNNTALPLKGICIADFSVVVLLTGFFIISEYPIARQYKKDITQTMSTIITESNMHPGERVLVKPIHIEYQPNAYCYFRNLVKRKITGKKELDDDLLGFFPYLPFELSTDPEDFRNSGLKEYLGVNNDIIGWVKPQK